MKANLGHLQLNITDPKKSFPFYKDLFKYLEYSVIAESEDYLGFSNGTTDFWIMVTEKGYGASFHRKQTGINHLAFAVSDKESVDKFVQEFLATREMGTLYVSPKHFPEYSSEYYAVFFEDPDRIKLEVMFSGH